MSRARGHGPPEVVARIESSTTRLVTPCGMGEVIWRVWGQGKPLLLLHGSSGSWMHWVRNIPRLAGRFRVLAPDMPGFGESAEPSGSPTPDNLAAALTSGLAAVVPPLARLDIAGFSFGGIVGGMMAAYLRDRVQTLTLFAPGGLGVPLAPPRSLHPILPDMPPHEVEKAHAMNLGILMFGDPTRADDLAVWVHMENVRRTRFKAMHFGPSKALSSILPDIAAQITCVFGGRDAFMAARLEDRRRALSAARGRVDFRVIDGAGYWVIYEAADQANGLLCP